MDSIILITSNTVDLNKLKNWISNLKFILTMNSLDYTENNAFINIIGNREIMSDYEEIELEKLNKYFKSPKFFYIDTNEFRLFKKFIKNFNPQEIVLFDNDRGRFYRKEDIMLIDSEQEFYFPIKEIGFNIDLK